MACGHWCESRCWAGSNCLTGWLAGSLETPSKRGIQPNPILGTQRGWGSCPQSQEELGTDQGLGYRLPDSPEPCVSPRPATPRSQWLSANPPNKGRGCEQGDCHWLLITVRSEPSEAQGWGRKFSGETGPSELSLIPGASMLHSCRGRHSIDQWVKGTLWGCSEPCLGS